MLKTNLLKLSILEVALISLDYPSSIFLFSRGCIITYVAKLITHQLTIAAGLGLIIYAGLAGGDVWTEFYQYFRESKFVSFSNITTLMCIFGLFLSAALFFLPALIIITTVLNYMSCIHNDNLYYYYFFFFQTSNQLQGHIAEQHYNHVLNSTIDFKSPSCKKNLEYAIIVIL